MGGRNAPGSPPTLDTLVARDEQAVDDEVARRLVPDAELAALVRELVAASGAAETRDVAAHFGVPVEVAARALRALDALRHQGRRRG